MNSSFMYYFKLQKLEFNQIIDDMAIVLLTILKFCKHKPKKNIYIYIYTHIHTHYTHIY